MASFRNNDKKTDIGFEHFVLKARNEHERKFFYIHDEFVPNSKAAAVTPKFYARHDIHEGEIPDPTYVKAIEDALIKGPKDRSDEPQTENQRSNYRYGWYIKPFLPVDKLLHHYHTHTPITIVAAEILMARRNLPKDPPFTGTPFKL